MIFLLNWNINESIPEWSSSRMMNDTVGAIKLQDNMRKSESFLGLAGYILNKTINFF